jgi:hypothetical protein
MIGSIKVLGWLATMINGPLEGIFSLSVMWIDLKKTLTAIRNKNLKKEYNIRVK